MTEQAFVLIWNTGLTLLIGLISWAAKTKEKEFDKMAEEVQRLGILLNRTREEVAKEYVTKVEVHADINRVLQSLSVLDAKIDRLMETKNAQH
jgi:hypothetical protein